jgi:molybdopterin-guanine dinucleotide biosynthesis protein A
MQQAACRRESIASTVLMPECERTLPAEAAGPGDRQRLPGWLVIGGTGRNSGKSDLACAVIARLHGAHPLVGVKVTTIADGERACPRGGEGCGACTGLEGEFEVREEDGRQPGKDTSRMLESGARRAFWVRCRSGGARAALAALATRLDPGTLVVAESNSLVKDARPDLFLMVRPGRSSPVKPTAAAVLPFAQRVVLCVDRVFDLDLRHLAVVDGEWHLAEASAAILAGGASSRMGRDKSLMLMNGRPLIQRVRDQLSRRFDDILISTNEPGKYSFLRTRSVPDLVPGHGPLMGIRTAVESARHDRVFVTACEIPVIDDDTVERMLVLAENFDCVIPRSRLGPEPLFAVYRKSAIPAMCDVLDSGERRIRAVFPKVRTHAFDLGPSRWYRNLNTNEDVTAFLESQGGSARPGESPDERSSLHE